MSMMDRPRQMSLAAFSWDENTLCQQFCSSGDNKEFIKVWKEKFLPHIDPDDGSFLPPLEQPTTPEAQERKRKTSCTPPSLLPATKAARVLQAQAKQSETSSHFDEKEMDEEICKHFVGETAKAYYFFPTGISKYRLDTEGTRCRTGYHKNGI